MDGNLQAIANVDRTIHEPSRLVILAILSCIESADFLYLLRETGMTKGNLSSHLAKLEESGYVEIEKTYRGKVPLTMCRLSKDGQSAFRQYLENLKRAMDSMPKLRSRDPKKQSRRFASSRFGARQALDGRLAPQ